MMTNEQLQAVGKILAACQALNPDLTPRIIAKAIRNPFQVVPFWYVDTMRKVTSANDNINGQMLADLGMEAGDIERVTPEQAGTIHIAYIKAKTEPAIIDARKAFGAKIKAAREAAGMTQESLAAAAGIKQANLARIESGRYNVTLDTITRLEVVLGKIL